jgi:galactokinase
VAALEDDRIRRRARHVVTEIARVRMAVDAITLGDWPALGGLFAASHASMRDDFEISCPELDVAVEAAVAAGAVGARMTGGGFGGSAVAVVPVRAVDEVTEAVATAFAAQGFTAPTFLLAHPSAAAGLVSPAPADE